MLHRKAWYNLLYGEPSVTMAELSLHLSDNIAQWDGAEVRTRYDEFLLCDTTETYATLAVEFLMREVDPGDRWKKLRIMGPTVMTHSTARSRVVPVPLCPGYRLAYDKMLLHLGYSLAIGRPLRIDLSTRTMRDVCRAIIDRNERASGPPVVSIDVLCQYGSPDTRSTSHVLTFGADRLHEVDNRHSALDHLQAQNDELSLSHVHFTLTYAVVDVSDPMQDFIFGLQRTISPAHPGAADDAGDSIYGRRLILFKYGESGAPYAPMRGIPLGQRDYGMIEAEVFSWYADREPVILQLGDDSHATSMRMYAPDTVNITPNMWTTADAERSRLARERRFRQTPGDVVGDSDGRARRAFVGEGTLRLKAIQDHGPDVWRSISDMALGRYTRTVFMSQPCGLFYVDLRDARFLDFVLDVLLPDRRTCCIFSATERRSRFSRIETEYARRYNDLVDREQRANLPPRYRGLLGEDKSDEKTAASLNLLRVHSSGSGLNMVFELTLRRNRRHRVAKSCVNFLRCMAMGTHNVVFGWQWILLRPVPYDTVRPVGE
jgi:hypothetical protein